MTSTPEMSIKDLAPRRSARFTKEQSRTWFRDLASCSKQQVPYYWSDPGPDPSWVVPGSRFSVLGREDRPKKNRTPTSCTRTGVLGRKCKRIVKLLKVEQSLKAVNSQPPNIVCGSLRASVRSMYLSNLTPVQELSIKTSAKAEVQPCTFCESLQEVKLDNFRKARSSPVEVCEEKLSEFARCFSENVPKGWNKRKVPYVPNGHGSLNRTRKEGGNWVPDVFSEHCRLELVSSKGKPRIVTLYSSYNVGVLTPLHNSLYSFLRRKSWLLVGKPTSENLRYLVDGKENPEWLSFDYESATDNIKTAYVQRAVEVLIDKGEGLSEDECRCLRVLSSLSLDGVSATSGQPMGSPMSFPLLCLINKTVVDLALTDLLIEGKIPFKEWTGHRCLINGDDLLTTSTSGGCLVDKITLRGSEVGLRVNREKTMQSAEYGEINSTVFRHCVEQKKTNVASLWMGAGVEDVLGFAHESTVRPRGFTAVVKANVSRLARQKTKTFKPLPFGFREALASCGPVKRALNSVPSAEVPEPPNLFPVEPRPGGFFLTREEEAEAITQRVIQVRDRECYKHIPAELRRINALRKRVGASENEGKCKPFALLKPHKPPEREDFVLSIFARYWQRKRKEELLAGEPWVECRLPPSDLTRIEFMLDLIKTFKDKRNGDRPISLRPPCGRSTQEWGEYVSLSDA